MPSRHIIARFQDATTRRSSSDTGSFQAVMEASIGLGMSSLCVRTITRKQTEGGFPLKNCKRSSD